MRKNIAVVGCGHWGKNLVRNFYELGALYCVCDPNKLISQEYAALYDVKDLEFKEIIENKNIEAIVLAVPAPLHSSMAIDAMNKGKHVYVEKPLAMNCKEAEEMISTSFKNNVHIMVGHLLQYHSAFIKLKELVKSNYLGNLKYIYSNRLSFGKVRTEEDVIWSFAPHDISMILSLVSELPSSINTESSSILNNSIADSAIIHMNFSSGIKAHINISWLHPIKEQRLVVIGDNGMIVFDDTLSWENKLQFYKHQFDFVDNKPNLIKSDMEAIQLQEEEPLKKECKYFVDLIEGKVPPLTDGHEGMQVLKVLSAASLSNTKAARVKLY